MRGIGYSFQRACRGGKVIVLRAELFRCKVGHLCLGCYVGAHGQLPCQLYSNRRNYTMRDPSASGHVGRCQHRELCLSVGLRHYHKRIRRLQ